MPFVVNLAISPTTVGHKHFCLFQNVEAAMVGRRRGFTLVELLVVIGIIALLISILLPVLNRVKWQAQITACSARMHDVTLSIIMYANDFHGNLPPFRGSGKAGSVTSDFYNTAIGISASPAWSLTTPDTTLWSTTDSGQGLGLLRRMNYIKSAQVFHCPDWKTNTYPNPENICGNAGYYVLNPHVAYVYWPGQTTLSIDYWWKRLPGYGNTAATGQFKTGSGSTTADTFTYTNWRRAILSEPMLSYGGGNDFSATTHVAGTRRGFNMGYPDGSVQTLIVNKYAPRAINTWYTFLNLSEAVQDAINGSAQVNLSVQPASSWLADQYSGIPIAPNR